MKPSQNTDEFWIRAFRKKGTYPRNTPNGGKWLIFLTREDVNSVWEIISEATESGLLGEQSKVSTARSNGNSMDKRQHVICVYTYDYTDEKDVMAIREVLRKLGITYRIPYKTNADTSKRIYGVKGDKNISKFYE